jgi:hypothetical protein
MIEIQEISFPSDCTVIAHDFYNYDPLNSFHIGESLKYLNEDLLQCEFEEEEMIIDLGWYGDIDSNKGEFRIYLIKDGNWELPFNIIHTKSVEEAKDFLIKILEYYTHNEIESDLNTL